MDLLDRLAPAPPDALMRAARGFAEDRREDKINLSVGLYYDEAGNIPSLMAVREAERRLDTSNRPWPYLQAEGLESLLKGSLRVCLGNTLSADLAERITVQQTIGGTGAIRLGAELIASLDPSRVVAVSKPSWPNHEAIFRAVGLRIQQYVYYDPLTGGLDADGMLRDLEGLPQGSIVVLHACCHNPTGIDPSSADWARISEVVTRRSLVPFLDSAYQGFGVGIEEDAAAVRSLVSATSTAFVASSFSKSFSLYGERVGTLSIIAPDSVRAAMMGELARKFTRTLHSSPPTHGAAVVSRILSDADLTGIWREELDGMRHRVDTVRRGLVNRLSRNTALPDFSFVLRQRGLFSYSGLSAAQVARLRDVHAIHAVEDGRLCLAALNTRNLDRVADAIRRVIASD
jgi:aromatic-amino-acid transaminase